MSDAAFEGDLSQRSLVAVLGEIFCRNLKGRLSVQAEGTPPLELHVQNGLASSPAGDPEAEVRQAVALGQGRYSLEPGPPPGAEASSLLRLVMAAARAIPSMDQVRSALGNLDAPLAITESGSDRLAARTSLSAEEGFLLSQVDSTGSLRQICQLSPIGEDETLCTIMGLTAAGLLQIGAAGDAPTEPAPRREPREDPMAKLQGFLKKTKGPAPASAESGKRAGRPAVKVVKAAAAPAEASSERMMLLDRLRASEAQNYYQLLEVETGASEEVIQKSYYSLARRFHPDRFHSPDVADLQPAMEMLFARVNQAFHTLKDVDRRREYDRKQAKGKKDVHKVQQAAAREVGWENYRRGRQLVTMGQYIKALPFLENAVRADESKAEYFETLGMVQSLNPRLKEAAETALKTACELAPARPTGYLRLGLHYFKTRQFEKAAKALQEALGWDPTDPLARMAMNKVKAGGASAVKDGTWLIHKLLQDQDES
jgi:tetratricopeptide (TPR) repeat protein